MVKNFLFHRVNPERDPLWDPMDVRLFEKCINYICKNYNVQLLEEIALHPDYADHEKRLASIVFDDGYKDNIEYALPILEKYHVKASFYVVTDCIEKNIPTWTHVIDYCFEHTSQRELSLDHELLPMELRVKRLNTTEERINYAKRLKPWLKKISHHQRTKIVESVRTSFNDVALPMLMLTWENLRYLKSLGHYVGSHTTTHSMLGTMDKTDEIKKELVESREKIAQRLGHYPLTISYPVGSYNQKVMELSRDAGYQIGLAVKQIPFLPGFHNNFEIPRIELYNERWIKTRLRIDNIYEKISKLLRVA